MWSSLHDMQNANRWRTIWIRNNRLLYLLLVVCDSSSVTLPHSVLQRSQPKYSVYFCILSLVYDVLIIVHVREKHVFSTIPSVFASLCESGRRRPEFSGKLDYTSELLLVVRASLLSASTRVWRAYDLRKFLGVCKTVTFIFHRAKGCRRMLRPTGTCAREINAYAYNGHVLGRVGGDVRVPRVWFMIFPQSLGTRELECMCLCVCVMWRSFLPLFTISAVDVLSVRESSTVWGNFGLFQERQANSTKWNMHSMCTMSVYTCHSQMIVISLMHI